MTTEETLEAVQEVFNGVKHRIKDIGDYQYSAGDTQAFETKDKEDIAIDLMEEVEDTIAYLAFLHIRIQYWLDDLRGIK